MIKSGHVIQLITESNQAVFCLACTSVRLIKVVSAGGISGPSANHKILTHAQYGHLIGQLITVTSVVDAS